MRSIILGVILIGISLFIFSSLKKKEPESKLHCLIDEYKNNQECQ